MYTYSFKVHHTVNHPKHQVWPEFSELKNAEALFKALSAGGPPMRIVRFEGCTLGAVVELNISLGPIKLPWRSVVTAYHEGVDECYFIDEGQVLPFGLEQFSHTHRITSMGSQTRISEEISLGSGSWLSALFGLVAFWGQMYMRGPAYRSHFKKRLSSQSGK